MYPIDRTEITSPENVVGVNVRHGVPRVRVLSMKFVRDFAFGYRFFAIFRETRSFTFRYRCSTDRRKTQRRSDFYRKIKNHFFFFFFLFVIKKLRVFSKTRQPKRYSEFNGKYAFFNSTNYI